MAVKTVTGNLIFIGPEASYLSGAALTGSIHCVQIANAADAPAFDIAYSYDGDRKGGQFTGGNLRRTTPSGRSVSGKITVEGKGLGAAYSTTANTVPNLHNLLLGSGFSASLNTGAWTFTPNALGVAPTSLAGEIYGRFGNGGEKLPISGAFAKMGFSSDGAGITTFTFDLMGVPADTLDAISPPARQFVAATIIPPKNELVAFTIGSYTSANIRKYSYDHGIDVGARINLNATGSHAGFYQGRRNPKFTITIEDDAFSNYNPLNKEKTAAADSLSLTVGTLGTNNSFTFIMASASLGDVKASKDGEVATWDLEFYPAVSAPDASDDVALIFNA